MEQKDVINRVSQLRTREKKSARAASILAGLNERYINGLENHRNHLPSIEALFAIIASLNSTPAEFFYHPSMSAYSEDQKLLKLVKENKEIFDLLVEATPDRRAAALAVLKLVF